MSTPSTMLATDAGYPLLSDSWRAAPGEPLGLVLGRLGLLASGERIEHVARAGEGNMNLTVRVTTSVRTLIVKQSRPWVEKYPSIPAPVERTSVEHAFYREIADIRGVAGRMPRVLGFDAAMHVLVLEDLGSLRDLTAVYRGMTLPGKALAELASYLVCLHAGTRGRVAGFPSNMAMRRLNFEHIFNVPLDPANGLDFDKHEPGLRAASAAIISDSCVRARFTALGARYLSPGPCLIHGDFFPGSWVEGDQGVRIIDPEFGFAGEAEFDVGVAMGHLTIADATGEMPRQWLAASLTAFESDGTITLDPRLVVDYAAVEMIRRLIGVAQLPMPKSDGRRAALLETARRALHTHTPESLQP